MGRSVAPVRSLLATARVRPESCRPWLSIMALGSTQSADPPAVPVLQRTACTAPGRPDAGATTWWSDRPIEPETRHHDARVCRQRRRAEYSRRPGANRPAGWRDWPGVALSAWSWPGLLLSGNNLSALVDLRRHPHWSTLDPLFDFAREPRDAAWRDLPPRRKLAAGFHPVDLHLAEPGQFADLLDLEQSLHADNRKKFRSRKIRPKWKGFSAD